MIANEMSIGKEDILIMRTTPQGQITEINDSFCRLTAFHRSQLYGKSQNLVRHNDVPLAIYADLDNALRQMRPWTGLLKYPTHSGDFFWARTNVIPEFEQGKLKGHLFISYAPKKGEIEKGLAQYNNVQKNNRSLSPSLFKQWLIKADNLSTSFKFYTALIGFTVPSAFLSYQLVLTENNVGLACFLVASFVAFINIFSARHFNHFLDKNIAIFYRLAEKKFGNDFDLNHSGIEGDFYRALFSMDVGLSLSIAQTKAAMNETMRISNALDGVHSAVLVTDNDFEVVFANQSALHIFRNAQSAIRTQLPHFDADKVLGSNIDIYHKQPEKQRDVLGKLTGYYASELEIGGHLMNVVANPIMNRNGEKVGYVAEWLDRTDETQALREITTIIQSATQGDFANRISESGKSGFILELVREINRLVEVNANSSNDVGQLLAALSHGDLTKHIDGDYQGRFEQIKNDANTTVQKLRDVIEQIQMATDTINGSAKEIASGNNDLSMRTEKQAASLEETAASMHELTSTVQNNSENAQHASTLATSASSIASKGVSVVEEVVDTMAAINDASHKIVDIIAVIDGIAFQTNILALNAAVEAARAGDQGRGFAVVAEEVRNLAQRVSAAAGEIKMLISDSAEKVEDGARLVSHAGSTMKEIVSAVNQVTGIMSEISVASIEQTNGIEQVNKAISQMDEVTQQNAALVEEAAAAAETLESQAQNLASAVRYFSLN